MNFENAEGLDFELTEEEISKGIQFQKYPISNETYASFGALSYNEYLRLKPNPSEQMNVLDSQMKLKYHGKIMVKKINPFKEDAFSLGLTLFQMATLASEEEV